MREEEEREAGREAGRVRMSGSEGGGGVRGGGGREGWRRSTGSGSGCQGQEEESHGLTIGKL